MKTISNLLIILLVLILCSVPAGAQSNDQHKFNPFNVKKQNKINSMLQPDIDPNYNGDPETDAMQERNFSGAAANDNFGTSSSSAGDVNGDGYDDVIAGAPNNDAGGNNSGRAYIYFGGPVVNSSVDLILTGAAANDNFGISVSGAGDVNGDGYADVIVGAHLNDAGGNNAGRAYIYFGGPIMNNVADIILTGPGADNFFGYSVNDAGDVNGDGFADVIVGAYMNNTNGVGTGRAFIYYGGSIMNNVADVTMTGTASGDNFGVSVSTAGDINGDGFADVIIGAILNDGPATDAGRAYVFLGGSSMDNLPDLIFNGSASADYFGYSVSGGGDINNDGYSDVLVGAPFNDASAADAGSVYVYYGGPVLNNTADIILSGFLGNDNFGTSVSIAGDVNADGYSDIIVGSTGSDAGGNNSGRAYLYFGGLNMDNIHDAIMTGAAANDNYGISVSGAGDINGDSFSDILCGASFNDVNGVNSGKVYLYLNSLTGNDIADDILEGNTGDNFGNAVSSGDVNGDGYEDFLIGAYTKNTNDGAAYLYFGGPLYDDVPDVTYTGVLQEVLGDALDCSGDLNGDGYDDVVIGASQNDAGGGNAGRLYVYFGSAVPDNIADVFMNGVAGDYLGSAIASGGDVNGDGYADILAGVPESDISNANGGAVYVYYGGQPMNNVLDKVLYESVPSGFYGTSVSIAGDINADGIDDFIVGAPGYTTDGAAFVYFGHPSLFNNSNAVLTGLPDSENFGIEVAGAGDVNGDGYNDVIVGAYQYPAFSDRGRAYLYYGGPSMNSTHDLTFTGELNQNYFSISMTSGNVNNDGYSDLIVAATGYDGLTSATGRVYVFFGSADPDNIADIHMDGDEENAAFGYAVDAADLNADGTDDILVGAYQDGLNGVNSGRSFVYMSTPPVIEPVINSVKDVAFDQGGFVNVKWTRSGYDIDGQDMITGYLVEKSLPPGAGGFSWQSITTIPATKNISYTYQAATSSDSMGGANGVNYYRVTALTTNVNQYWRSNNMPGYSVDNLSPAAPMDLEAVIAGNIIELLWSQNTEQDFHHYIVYRNGLELGTSNSNSFTDDTAIPEVSYTYHAAAADIHGNVSELSNPANASLSSAGRLTLYFAIEGFYDLTTNTMRRDDTVTVYLRNSIAPYDIVDASMGVVSGSSLSGIFEFANAPSGNYFIVADHRNSIETWSAYPSVFVQGGMSFYTFLGNSLQAYGGNLTPVDSSPQRFGIYSGDINKDGSINLTDILSVYNSSSMFTSGYVSQDVTGDDHVNLTDILMVYNNSAKFVTKSAP